MKIKFLFAIATIALVISAAAQQTPTYSSQTLGNFTCAAQAATNVAYVIDCRKQANVSVQCTFTNDASGTADVGFAFVRSVDGITYDTRAGLVINIPANATTKVSVCTNVATFGAGYLKVLWVTNSAATANVGIGTMKYGIKIQAP